MERIVFQVKIEAACSQPQMDGLWLKSNSLCVHALLAHVSGWCADELCEMFVVQTRIM